MSMPHPGPKHDPNEADKEQANLPGPALHAAPPEGDIAEAQRQRSERNTCR